MLAAIATSYPSSQSIVQPRKNQVSKFPHDFALLLPASIVAVVLVMPDGSLFDVTAFPKLHIVSILFFWTDGQDGVEFF